MFNEHFGLSRAPFTKDIPCDSLYMTDEQEETLSRLKYVADRKLFAVVTGECGVGKSTVIRKLSDSLDEKKFDFLYVADSQLTPRHFYNGLLSQLGREGAFYRGDSKRKLHHEIEQINGVRHRQLIVVVDEAHLLDAEMLEELRFLLNFKMDSESPLALVLVGQTELEAKLERRISTAIRQRVDFRCRLSLFDVGETGRYIEHQMRIAGAKQAIFSDSAVKEIFSYSAGSARLINKACSSCLMFAFMSKTDIIDGDIVKNIIESEFK
jgi:type II secretory pathway predicted ATPase ExeA